MPLGQSRVYRVTQLRTDGILRRESADTGLKVLKVVPVMGELPLQGSMEHLICTSLFPLLEISTGNLRCSCRLKCYWYVIAPGEFSSPVALGEAGMSDTLLCNQARAGYGGDNETLRPTVC